MDLSLYLDSLQTFIIGHLMVMMAQKQVGSSQK